MFRNVKIVTSLAIVLGLFSLLQLTSAGLFFKSLNTDKDNLTELNSVREEQSKLDSSWTALLQARNDVTLAAHYYSRKDLEPEMAAYLKQSLIKTSDSLKEVKKSWSEYQSTQAAGSNKEILAAYTAYYNALSDMLNYIKTNNMTAVYAQDTQSYQDKFFDTYARISAKNNDFYREALSDSQQSFSEATWLTAASLIIALSIAVVVWQGTKVTLINPLNRLIEEIRLIADGELVHKIDVEGRNEMGLLAESLRHMQEALARTVGNVRSGAEAIFSGASEISVGSTDLSSRTEQQAASLEQTAASMEELTATVKQNAENASQASQLALSASDVARHGGKVVDNVVNTMTEIASSSQKIADITNVIDGIAFQTNILALNAAVEAARAGEQGRGFAVVASEVRNLAQRSAQAAREIKQLIDESVSKVDTGSTLVESAGETMGDIVKAVSRVTDIMSEIASASDEQSRGIDQIGLAVTEMDRVTQQNSGLVQESAAAATALEEQASRLSEAVAVFRINHRSGAAA